MYEGGINISVTMDKFDKLCMEKNKFCLGIILFIDMVSLNKLLFVVLPFETDVYSRCAKKKLLSQFYNFVITCKYSCIYIHKGNC